MESVTLNDQMLIVEPNVANFDSVTPGKLYILTVSLKNASNKAQRIRVQAPKSTFFAINYVPSKAVAPGLDVRAEIECFIPLDSEYNEISFFDRIIASMGDCKVEIPLMASKSHAVIEYETLLDFGDVGQGQSSSKLVKFRNIGTARGTLSLKVKDNPAVTMSPKELTIEARDETVVSMTILRHEAGGYRDVIAIDLVGCLRTYAYLDVTATITERKLILLGPNRQGGIVESLDYGVLYYGQQKTFKTMVVNTGSLPLTYSFKEVKSEPATLESTFMTIRPSDGIIQPFSELPVEITCQPILSVPKKGFFKEFLDAIKIPVKVSNDYHLEAEESGHKQSFSLSCTAVNPSLIFSHERLDFGGCGLADRRDIRATFTNKSPTAVYFEFSRHPYFKFTPSSGKIHHLETISIVATFLPLQLGVFDVTVTLSVPGCSYCSISIRAHGEATATLAATKRTFTHGIDKLPEDFTKSLKFIDEDLIASKSKVSTTTAKPKPPTLDELSISVRGSEAKRDETSALAFDDTAQDSFQRLRERKLKEANDKYYNEYLQKSHRQRNESTK